MWTTNGEVVEAGDVFGDNQVGPAWGLVYTNPAYPHERLCTTFGVVSSIPGRYSGHVEFIHEQWIEDEWELTDESEEGGAFYIDHDNYAHADEDVDKEIQRWKGFAFDDILWFEQVTNK